MDIASIFDAVVLGIVEGVTEFIPVSSTAHLLLAGRLLGFESAGKAFEVLIQLGAILALLTVYAARLRKLIIDLPRDRRTQRFALGVIIAFLPAAILGVTFHKFITGTLFNSVLIISLALIIGGVALIWIDRLPLKPRRHDVMDYPLLVCLGIGLFQCLSLIPGVSRSGATIAGALLLGGDRRTAAEYSFFLAMPTMAGAFVYDLYQNIGSLDAGAGLLIAVGFAVAFVSALVVVRGFLDFVSARGFAPFGWWRIAVGVLGLIAVFAFGVDQPATTTASGRAVTLELAARTKALEVARQDRGEAVGIDPQRLDGAALGFGGL